MRLKSKYGDCFLVSSQKHLVMCSLKVSVTLPVHILATRFILVVSYLESTIILGYVGYANYLFSRTSALLNDVFNLYMLIESSF